MVIQAPRRQRHRRHFFQHDGVMHGFLGVFPPTEWGMTIGDHAWDGHWVDVPSAKGFHDADAGVFFVGGGDFF